MKAKIFFFAMLCFQIIAKAQSPTYIPNYDTVLHFAGEEISDYPLTQRITK
ncbi:MAG: hypothetical protein IJ213_06950 [Bacteroidales bacterium]|nr:hypothetical protein [Bacteroidales bacterium]